MARTRGRSVWLVVAGLALAALGGCRQPWRARARPATVRPQPAAQWPEVVVPPPVPPPKIWEVPKYWYTIGQPKLSEPLPELARAPTQRPKRGPGKPTPSRGRVLEPGHWRYVRGQYHWEPPRWVNHRGPGYTWEPATEKKTRWGWRRVRGHW